MSKKIIPFPNIVFIGFLTALLVVGVSHSVRGAGDTTYPWPSWRHDLSNSAAAPDSGFSTAADVL
jgi:hypothetical protein